MGLLDDYVQARSALAVAGLCIITVLNVVGKLDGMAFATCFGAIFACYSAHSVLDDKWPDRRNADDIHS